MIFMRQEEVYLKKHKKEKVALMLIKVQSSKFRGQEQKAEWERNIHSHFLVYKAKSHKV